MKSQVMAKSGPLSPVADSRLWSADPDAPVALQVYEALSCDWMSFAPTS